MDPGPPRHRQPERQDHRSGGPRGYDAATRSNAASLTRWLMRMAPRSCPNRTHRFPGSQRPRAAAARLARSLHTPAGLPPMAPLIMSESPRTPTSPLRSCERDPHQIGFAVLPRGLLERLFASIRRNRRLATEFLRATTIKSVRATSTEPPSCCSSAAHPRLLRVPAG